MVVWIRGSLGGRDFTDRALKAHRRAMADRAGWAALAPFLPEAAAAAAAAATAEERLPRQRLPGSSSSSGRGERRREQEEVTPFGMRYLLGTHLLRMGEASEAVAVLAPLALEGPSRPGVLNNLAVAQFHTADKAGAIRTLRKAVKERPLDGEVHTNLGKFLLAEGHLGGSARALGRAVAMGHPSAIGFVACGVMAYVVIFSAGMFLFMWFVYPRVIAAL